ncbi:unnamed protein product, partial [Rotaria sp. Silwood2]
DDDDEFCVKHDKFEIGFLVIVDNLVLDFDEYIRLLLSKSSSSSSLSTSTSTTNANGQQQIWIVNSLDQQSVLSLINYINP